MEIAPPQGHIGLHLLTIFFLLTVTLSTCEDQFDQIFSLVSQGGGQILFTDLEKLYFWHQRRSKKGQKGFMIY